MTKEHPMKPILKENHTNMISKLELPAEIVAKLADLTEQGMGYQIKGISF